MSIVYIGAFPSFLSGGVTNKNRDLYEALKKEGLEIKKIDLHKISKGKSFTELFHFALALVNKKNKFIIGISTGTCTRRLFSKLLYIINRESMKKSIIMIMGGTDDKNIVADADYKKWMSCYRKVYVETEAMKYNLENAGMINVDIYPNGRFKPLDGLASPSRSNDRKLQCVFFSLIQPEKGADLVLEAAKELPNVQFTFFGNIIVDYREEFLQQVEALPNVSYNGIFRGSSNDVYVELAKHDVLLFPTKWDIEGVPGILVEGKIAGLAEIVSDKSYNSEIVKNNIEGIVLQYNTSMCLKDAIESLDKDRELLKTLKIGSYESAEKYYIENYIDMIREDLEE